MMAQDRASLPSLSRELCEQAIALISSAIAELIEDVQPEALRISGPRAMEQHMRAAVLLQVGEDVSILAHALAVFVRRGDEAQRDET